MNQTEKLSFGEFLRDIQLVITSPTAFILPSYGQKPVVVGYSVSKRPIHIYSFGQGEKQRMIVAGIPFVMSTYGIYRGFVLVKHYRCFAYSIAEKSSQHARALFFDREIERVTDIAWDQAVNDTASFWQSVFRRAPGTGGLPGEKARVRSTGAGQRTAPGSRKAF